MNKSEDNITIIIRKGVYQDLPEMKTLFVDSIQTVCRKDYTTEQINAWTSSIHNEQRWNDIITNQTVWIAVFENKIVGFSSLDKLNYIDLLYVHKEFQGKGIAKKLYKAMETMVMLHKQHELFSDVSKTAKPFFERMGFKVQKTQAVQCQNIELINYKMKKIFN